VAKRESIRKGGSTYHVQHYKSHGGAKKISQSQEGGVGPM